MRKLILDLSSLENTDTVARKMAANLFPGAILLFWGSMGAGKTTFAKSLCTGLGIPHETVISPTYTMVNIYSGKWTILHVDLFRLTASEQLDDFDREDLITDEGVTLVEWPQFLLNYLSDEPVLNLAFETVSEYQRWLSLESESADFDILFKTLEQQNTSLPKSANYLNRVGT
ncbi:MAG: tRNA (adenosine(37)-N6)-threonylcarbamoyltransferase complex ATPase subunit type 1 TsaE [SAR324 cluster bacterium]|nr:tRNA (adenosine(37)-N6)-threonylcarbamoyltransferase complex ATPase subunit type 1 TsaE [SAR324 cluster bacterium]